MIRLLAMSVATLLAATSVFACPPENYEFGNVKLTANAEMIKENYNPETSQKEYKKFKMTVGKVVNTDATGGIQDVTLTLTAKLKSSVTPKGIGGKAYSIYEVTEKTVAYETPSGKPETFVNTYSVNVSRTVGTRGGCGEVVKTKL